MRWSGYDHEPSTSKVMGGRYAQHLCKHMFNGAASEKSRHRGNLIGETFQRMMSDSCTAEERE